MTLAELEKASLLLQRRTDMIETVTNRLPIMVLAGKVSLQFGWDEPIAALIATELARLIGEAEIQLGALGVAEFMVDQSQGKSEEGTAQS